LQLGLWSTGTKRFEPTGERSVVGNLLTRRCSSWKVQASFTARLATPGATFIASDFHAVERTQDLPYPNSGHFRDFGSIEF